MNSKSVLILVTTILISLVAALPALAGSYTTASMDTGTGNSETSWYEQGYNTDNPTTGLPPAGSTFTHQNATNHQYTMAATYRANNAVLLDSTLTNVTLALVTPAAYAKLSFLESGGHNGVTFGYTTAVSGPIRYTELTYWGHDIWSYIYTNASPALYDWMFAQTRPPATSSLTGTVRTNNAVVLNAACDVPFASAYLVGTTNLGLPSSQWPCLATNCFDKTGRLTFPPTPTTSDASRFYRVRTP